MQDGVDQKHLQVRIRIVSCCCVAVLPGSRILCAAYPAAALLLLVVVVVGVSWALFIHTLLGTSGVSTRVHSAHGSRQASQPHSIEWCLFARHCVWVQTPASQIAGSNLPCHRSSSTMGHVLDQPTPRCNGASMQMNTSRHGQQRLPQHQQGRRRGSTSQACVAIRVVPAWVGHPECLNEVTRGDMSSHSPTLGRTRQVCPLQAAGAALCLLL